ncbi:cytosine permease [Saccharopolyspora gloriosae]|uniref:purine-cytosine permease family protein n=1 Tax=Saccharopolyspora gloriosae TaxID=455344 RepID=UPI0028683A82|nr:cytosine permease [Saccharopolyspora gloriosae]
MSETPTGSTAAKPLEPPQTGALGAVEQRGIEPVPVAERRGNPMQLFWVWFAANISVVGMPLGVSLVALDLSVWQALIVAVIGAFGSFAVVGLISVAGRRGGAPSLTLSRAVFGTRGNAGPTAIALVSRLGWETVNTSTAALAIVTSVSLLTGTGEDAKSAPLVAVAGVALFVGFTVAVSGMGHAVILVVQKWSTWIFGAVNLLLLAFLVVNIDWAEVGRTPSGGLAAVLTGIGTIVAGTGIGWANSGADMARYQAPTVRALPLVMSAAAGAGIPLVVMIGMGSVLGASDPAIATAANPLDAIRDSLPTWIAVGYMVISFIGLLLSNHLSVYSAGLTTLTLGLRVKRVYAVIVDVVITTIGSLLFLLVADGFYGPFTTFISLLAVPISAWVGIFLVDMIRRRDYDPEALLDLSRRGAYYYTGGVRWSALGSWLAAIVVAALFMQVTPGDVPLYTGPMYDTWIGTNGMSWILAAGLGGLLYAVFGLRSAAGAK